LPFWFFLNVYLMKQKHIKDDQHQPHQIQPVVNPGSYETKVIPVLIRHGKVR